MTTDNDNGKPETYTQLQFPGMSTVTPSVPGNYSMSRPDPPKEISSLGHRVASLEVKMATLVETAQELKDLLDSIQQQVIANQTAKAGRKPKIMVEPYKVGVCGLYPESDDTVCPHANVYRYQQGCKGTACVVANTSYYANRRQAKEED